MYKFIYVKPRRVQVHQTIPHFLNLCSGKRSFREKNFEMDPQKKIYQRSEDLSLLPHMSTHKLEQLKLALRLLVMNAWKYQSACHIWPFKKRQCQHAEKRISFSARIEIRNSSDTLQVSQSWGLISLRFAGTSMKTVNKSRPSTHHDDPSGMGSWGMPPQQHQAGVLTRKAMSCYFHTEKWLRTSDSWDVKCSDRPMCFLRPSNG